MKKSTRGGFRPGSGRPKKEATTTVAFRVKVQHVDQIKTIVKSAIAEMEKGPQSPGGPSHENKNPELF